MGSTFFRQGLDPIGSVMGKFAGNNSWLARMTSYDPVMSSGVGKFMNPSMYARGQAYSQRHQPPPGFQDNTGAGGPASLEGANEGYIAASQRLMNNANTNIMNGTTQRTVTQGQPQPQSYY